MLTPQGEQMLAQATGRIREIEQQMVGGLSDTQRQELWDLLTACIEGIKETLRILRPANMRNMVCGIWC